MRVAWPLISAVSLLMPIEAIAASASIRTAAIVADNIYFAVDSTEFIADGNVEILWADETLRATRLEFRNEILQIEGPITLATTGGQALMLADEGEISADLQQGILKSIQILLAQEIQLTANTAERKNGRYYRLKNAVVTLCKVCNPGETPLWHYRARYVVHDTESRQLYLYNARLVIGRFALPAIPLIRFPDPTTRRMTGFLFPTIRFSRGDGLEIATPYFLTLGDHADLTFMPRISTNNRKLLDFEYRRRFIKGHANFQGALAYSGAAAEKWQRRVGVDGAWDLGSGYKFSFDGEKVSDRKFYDATGVDVPSILISRVRVTRRQEDSFFDATGKYFKRFGRSPPPEPNVVVSLDWRRKLHIPSIGGSTGFSLGFASYNRPADGRDVARGNLALDWTRTWGMGGGMLVTATGLAAARSYTVRNDADYGSPISTTTQTAALEFRLPLKRTVGEKTEVLDPFAQFVWSPSSLDEVPDEDGRTVEFDHTNLASLDRFGGIDRSERGARLNLGVKHTRIIPGTMEWDLVFGRVFRNKDYYRSLSEGSLAPTVLTGRRSDYVGGLDLKFASGLGVNLSVLFDDNISLSKIESLVSKTNAKHKWSIGYSQLEKGVVPGMTGPRAAWLGNSRFDLGKNWYFNTTVKYDRHKSKRSADVDLIYRQQCMQFKISILHERNGANAPTKTKYDFSVAPKRLGRSGQGQSVGKVCS